MKEKHAIQLLKIGLVNTSRYGDGVRILCTHIQLLESWLFKKYKILIQNTQKRLQVDLELHKKA